MVCGLNEVYDFIAKELRGRKGCEVDLSCFVLKELMRLKPPVCDMAALLRQVLG